MIKSYLMFCKIGTISLLLFCGFLKATSPLDIEMASFKDDDSASLSSASLSSGEKEALEDFEEGCKHYATGELLEGVEAYDAYKEAVPLLKNAAEYGYREAQYKYAQIIQGNLDGTYGPLSEAAYYAIMIAYSGEGEELGSDGALNRQIPGLLTHPSYSESSDSLNAQSEESSDAFLPSDEDISEKASRLVLKWALDKSMEEFFNCPRKPTIKFSDITAIDIVKYINHRKDQNPSATELGLTAANKLVYFFYKSLFLVMRTIEDDIFHANLSLRDGFFEGGIEEMDLEAPSIKQENFFYQQPRQDKKIRTLKDLPQTPMSTKSILITVKSPVEPFQRGPVFKSIEQKHLKQPKERLKNQKIYEYLIQSLVSETENMNASMLEKKSHNDYPWILAGLDCYEKCYGKNMDLGGKVYEIAELREKFLDFSTPIDELWEKNYRIFNLIKRELEDESIWPNTKEIKYNPTHPEWQLRDKIGEDYKKNIPAYFSQFFPDDDSLVTGVCEDFFEGLSHLKLIYPHETLGDFLRTPIFICYFSTLHLYDFTFNKKNWESFQKAQRYFLHLTGLTISYRASVKKNIYYKNMMTLLKVIKKGGIYVTHTLIEEEI